MPDPPQPERKPVDYVGLADEVAKYWSDVATRVGEGLKKAAADAQANKYTADRFLDDVSLFWKSLAEDLDRGTKNWKTYVVDRGNAAP